MFFSLIFVSFRALSLSTKYIYSINLLSILIKKFQTDFLMKVTTEEATRSSELQVHNLNYSDAGNYTCQPSNASPVQVTVQIFKGSISCLLLFFLCVCVCEKKNVQNPCLIFLVFSHQLFLTIYINIISNLSSPPPTNTNTDTSTTNTTTTNKTTLQPTNRHQQEEGKAAEV